MNKKTETGSSSLQYALILAILFSAGLSGLIYEVVWSRVLTLTFGGTVFAASAVLCAFMAGLAAGSWISGRIADGYKSETLLLSYVQFVLGALGLGLLPVFPLLTKFYVSVSRLLDPGFYLLTVIRFFFSVLVLSLPAALIASVFPIVVKLSVSFGKRFGGSIALVYGIDTMGAVAGAILTGFVLLPYIGVIGTVCIASSLNFIAGLTAVMIYRNKKPHETSADNTIENADAEGCSDGPLSPGARRVLLFMFVVSGAAALSYEVLVTKVMVHLLWMHIHAVSTMLACFLFGLGLGSLLCLFFIRSSKSLLLWFFAAEAGIGLIGFSLPLQFNGVPEINFKLQGLLQSWHSLGLDSLVQPLICLAVLIAPTVLMGTTLPLLISALVSSSKRVASGTGTLYALNTLGGVLGILFTTFVAMPFWGFKTGMFIAGGMNIVVAFSALWFYPAIRPRIRLIMGAGVVAASVLIIVLSSHSSLNPILMAKAERMFGKTDMLFFKEGANGTVSVLLTSGPREGYNHQMVINGNPEGGTDIASLRAFQILGNVPFFLHEDHKKPKRVLVLAFGMGITLGTVADHNCDSIECVELVPEVLEASRFFSAYNHNVLSNPKVEMHIEDARNFLLTTNKKYDIVILDATHPVNGDSWMLYTRECYRSVKDVLAAGGVVAQWIPAHGLTPESYLSILKTMQSVFPHVTLWSSPDNIHTVVVGTSQKALIDIDHIGKNMSGGAIDINMESAEISDEYSLLTYYIADETAIAEISKEAPVNTDNLSPVQFTKQLVLKIESLSIYSLLTRIKQNPWPLILHTKEEVVMDSIGGRERIEKEFEASKYLRKGVYLMQAAQNTKDKKTRFSHMRTAGRFLQRAYFLNPDDRDASLFLGKERPKFRSKESVLAGN